MGALRKVLPFTWAMMLIGTLSLTGFPFTAGYFSKDAVIEAAYGALNPVASYAWFLTVSAALMTASSAEGSRVRGVQANRRQLVRGAHAQAGRRSSGHRGAR